MKSKNIIYISTLILFILVVGFIFYASAKFFSEKINSAFTIDEGKVDSGVVKVDLETYRQIAPKFGIITNFPQ